MRCAFEGYGQEDDNDVVKAAFETFDLDGNGKISRQELKQVMEKLGETLTDKDLDALLKGLNLDDKGQLTYSGTGYGQEDDNDVVKAAFETFDLDGNGKISRQELKQVMEKLGETLTDKDLDALLKGLNLDDKGQLTYSGTVRL
ncbi:hypothetical protein KUTeg_012947 [Tegillarca granosa]|uniref:EF-hand domain-containing protein n=1 Tax=Tegillarca granosa TaxID=220873 RepID=A0ABQ9ES95_TEGGR|nr:hypothetical protein KUTeg_012947 [Tegillarca granosa]